MKFVSRYNGNGFYLLLPILYIEVCVYFISNKNAYTFHVRGMKSNEDQSGATDFTREPRPAAPLISYGGNYGDG